MKQNVKIAAFVNKGLVVYDHEKYVDVKITDKKGIRFNKINKKLVDITDFWLVYFVKKFNGHVVAVDVEKFSLDVLKDLQETEFEYHPNMELLLSVLKKSNGF